MTALMNAIPWIIWSVAANFAIAATEYLNRTGGYEHAGHAFLRTAPLILIAQVGLFYAWRDAPSFMTAWATFTIGNIGLRVLSAHFIVGERMTLDVFFGIAMIVMGGHLVRQGVGAST
jgi:multidrug transporter EmrE-like cation transporter